MKYMKPTIKKYLDRVVKKYGGNPRLSVLGYCFSCGDNFARFTGMTEYRSDVLCDACLVKSLQSTNY